MIKMIALLRWALHLGHDRKLPCSCALGHPRWLDVEPSKMTLFGAWLNQDGEAV